MQRNDQPASIPGSEPAISSNYKWWVVFMLWFICFFNYADRQAISVVLPKLHEEFGFDKEQLGYIASAFMWIYAAGAPLAGYIGDRMRRKDLILGGCLFWSFVTILTGWCSKLWHFVTVRALEGFGETFYFPASMSLVSDYHSPRTRSRAMSVHQSSVYIGTIGGSFVAAWLAEHYNWRWGFYLFGTMGMILGFILYKFLREPRRGESEPGVAQPEAVNDKSLEGRLKLMKLLIIPAALLLLVVFWGRVGPLYGIPIALLLLFGLWSALGDLGLQSPTVLLLLLGFMGANCVASIFLLWTPTFLVEKFNFRLTTAGLSGSVYIQVASALSVPLGGILADWLSRKHAGGRMFVQGGALLAGAAFVSVVGMTQDYLTLIVAMSIFGFCKGLYDANIFASMYDVVRPEARASAAGIMNMVGWAAGAVGVSVFGSLAKNGKYGSEVENMSHIIAFGGAIYLGAAVLLFTAALFFAKRDVLRVRRGA